MKKQSSESSRNLILTAVRCCALRTAVVSSDYDTNSIYNRPADLLSVFVQEAEAVAASCFVFSDEESLYSQLSEMVRSRSWTYLFTKDVQIQEKCASFNIPFSCDEKEFNVMPAAVTPCEFLVARTGSILMSSAQDRRIYAYAPVHIVVAHEGQLVDFPENALMQFRQRYPQQLPASFGFVTGPSRTADIEKTLVLGAHGPKELIIFVLKNKANESNESF